MKVLYADLHLHSLNPTNTLTSTMVAAAVPNLHFYGPGFSSKEDTAGGILRFIERMGPYDGIIMGPNTLLWARDEQDYVRSAESTSQHTALSSSVAEIIAYNKDIHENLRRLPVQWRVACLFTTDCYAINARIADRLEELDLHILAPDAQFAPTPDQLPQWVWEERHFIRKRDTISNAWHDFLTQHANRVISLPHFIGSNEFFFRGLSERRVRISAPGVSYVMRERGVAELRSRGVRVRNKHVFNAYRALNKLGIHTFSNFVSLRLFNTTFQHDLIQSRFVYTAPEGFHIPVRKFFEIPAAGAMMLCVPPWAFEALGFSDGQHYVKVSPETLPDTLFDIEKDEVRAQCIAAAGRSLVLERHSLHARATQLAACLNAMSRDEFNGSYWSDGTFRLREAVGVARTTSKVGGRVRVS